MRCDVHAHVCCSCCSNCCSNGVPCTSRTASAALLLDSLREINHDVTHLVSASAIGAYPSSLKTIYSEEDDEYHPGFLGQVVSAWEASADKFAEQDILVTKIRVGVVPEGIDSQRRS